MTQEVDANFVTLPLKAPATRPSHQQHFLHPCSGTLKWPQEETTQQSQRGKCEFEFANSMTPPELSQLTRE
jgi:hypothetical protein